MAERPCDACSNTVILWLEVFDYIVMCLLTGGNLSVGIFRRAKMVNFSANFRWKGVSPTNQCWCQKTRVIAHFCGIKISALHCSVLPQSTCVTDRRTNKITTPTTTLAKLCHAVKSMADTLSNTQSNPTLLISSNAMQQIKPVSFWVPIKHSRWSDW